MPGYFELLLAFPKAPRGSISVQTWALACGAAVNLVVGKVLVGGVGGVVKGAVEKKRRQRVVQEVGVEGEGEGQRGRKKQ